MRATAVSAVFMAIMMVALLGMPLIATAQTPGQDTLIVGVQNDTPNLVPWDIATNSIWKAFLWENWVYENLYSLTPDGSNIYPVLAVGNPSPDPSGLNVTVHIRTGITFTDGQPMNMTDVLFSYQVMAFNSQLSDAVLKSVVYPDATWPRWNATLTAWGAAHPSHVGVTATDATTLVFHLRQPYSMFYFGTLPTPIMPAHIWKDHLVQVDLTNFVIPGGAPINPAHPEFDLDTSYGTSPSDVRATVGTGPWYLVQWTPLVSAEIRIYAGYWGKSQTVTFQGTTYPFYPNNLRTIQFRIYGTLDVAVLALKSGEVHIVPWNLPIGFYNDLRQDPRMGFRISASDGFYYLSFNMRKAPMNDLNFRKAIGFAIDKDFIVDRLLAGFGIKGQVPISPVNPGYINSSALAPSFDLAQANAILDAAGYTYSGQYRTMPGGAPLHLTILTPAKDYDPVRADTGIMVSNNLKKIGLNIDSSPTAFDAIVSAVFTAVQFDMYILGWVNLGPFPELYLSDFFGCDSLVELGTGDNTPGFCNQQLEGYLDTLDGSMNNAQRIQAAKDAEGLLTEQLPYNTLYNTRQIEGYRADVWSGWVPIRGEIFNAFSFGILGEPAQVVPTGPLSISLNMPGQAVAGTLAPMQIYAVQAGMPADDVFVNVTASTGDYANATTGSDGYATLQFPIPYVGGQLTFIATATKGTFTGGDSGSMNVILPNEVAQLVLTSSTPVIAPGQTSTITAKVTDKAGAPIANAPVSIIKQLVLGNVTPDSANTDATGTATFTYTAPSAAKIPNRNQYDFVKASVNLPSKPKVPDVKGQTLVMGVDSTVSDWYLVGVNAPTTMVIGTSPPYSTTTDITVKVTKQDGTAVASEPVTASFNSTAISVSQATKNTDALGQVTFTFTALTGTSTAVPVNFTVNRAFFALSGLCLLVTDGTTPGNATYMTVNPEFAAANSPVSVSVYVVDEHGNPANNNQVNIFIPYNAVGNPVSVAGAGWTFMNYVGSLFTGMTGAGGSLTTSFSTKSFPSDNVVVLETSIGTDLGPLGNFQVNFLTTHASTYSYQHVVQQRNKLVAVSALTMAPALMTKSNPVVNVTATFMDNAGLVQGLAAALYRGKGDLRPGKGATQICTGNTDSAGQLKCQWTEPIHDIDTALPFTAVYTDSNYALGGQIGSTPFEAIYPYMVTTATPTGLIPTGSPKTTIVALGSPQTYNITVKDFVGLAVQSATVRANVAGNVSAQTDGTGFASLAVMPSSSALSALNPTDISELVFSIAKGSDTTTIQMGTLVGIGVFVPSNLNVPGSATVGEAATITVDVRNIGAVQDMALVTLMMDGKPYSGQAVRIGPNATVTVSFTYVPSDTNSHAFSVGGLPEASLMAGGAGVGMAVVAGVGIVLLIVGILIGWFIGKRGKKEAPAEEMPPAEMPPEPPKQ